MATGAPLAAFSSGVPIPPSVLLVAHAVPAQRLFNRLRLPGLPPRQVMALALASIMIFPQITLWLPDHVLSKQRLSDAPNPD
ncbi:hypothetical protein [Ruegeria marina]|uniref:Tripartite ATP-independent transporter, DctM component n=1 Tax=Ruegeria marina TaxID=639004 RepID=A0A1G6QAT1_9RHOB|nr:hypothetical protein [Ruegeria marina]SDC89403.1 hypothetical protein SAMN04488239_10469 [Ruegeria marina]